MGSIRIPLLFIALAFGTVSTSENHPSSNERRLFTNEPLKTTPHARNLNRLHVVSDIDSTNRISYKDLVLDSYKRSFKDNGYEPNLAASADSVISDKKGVKDDKVSTRTTNEPSEADVSKVTFPSLNDYETLNFNSDPETNLDYIKHNVSKPRNNSYLSQQNDVRKVDVKVHDDVLPFEDGAEKARKRDCVLTLIDKINANDVNVERGVPNAKSVNGIVKNIVRRKILRDKLDHLTRRKRYVVCGSAARYRYQQIPNCVGWTYYHPYPISCNCEPVSTLPSSATSYSGPAKTWFGPKYGESFIVMLGK